MKMAVPSVRVDWQSPVPYVGVRTSVNMATWMMILGARPVTVSQDQVMALKRVTLWSCLQCICTIYHSNHKQYDEVCKTEDIKINQ